MKTSHRSLIILALFATCLFARAAEISTFSPEGYGKSVRQVRVGFSEQIVAFGDPRVALEIFDVNCPEKGTSRWADGKNWVYDFDRDLPAGVQCHFKLKPGVKSLKGDPVGGRREFSFSTGGPAIARIQPFNNSMVEEDQAFLLMLDAEPDHASVLEHAYFTVEGVQERIPVKILEGKERQEILSSTAVKYQLADDKTKNLANFVIQPTRHFPPNAKVALVWDKGIRSPSGVPTVDLDAKNFQVREPFTAKLTCERENENAGCIPFGPLWIQFSSDVSWERAKNIRLRGANGKEWLPTPSPKPGDYKGAIVSSVKFEALFPAREKMEIAIPADFRDDSGRTLANASKFPLKVELADYPPLAKFSGEFGILERKPQAILPVTLRNIELAVKAKLGLQQVSRQGAADTFDGKMYRINGPAIKTLVDWFDRIGDQGTETGRGRSIFHESNPKEMAVKDFQIKKPHGAKAFEVVGIPLEKPGLYIVQLESRLLGKSLLGNGHAMYVSTAALVTNLAVHFKNGRESSVAWVTTLDEGKPVKEALVGVRGCDGRLVAKGITDASGIVKLPAFEKPPRCDRHAIGYSSGYFVTAEKDDDFSFSHTSWNKGIENWRFNLPGGWTQRPDIYHTVFDRPLFRAGETVHMKHFIRHHTTEGFSMAKDLPRLAVIRHLGSEQRYDLPLKWDGHGVAVNDWHIPKEAKLGEYAVFFKKEDKHRDQESDEADGEESGLEYDESRYFGSEGQSGSFRVEQFRVPLMKSSLHPPASDVVASEKVPIDIAVSYLSGGGAADLPVQIRYQQSLFLQKSLPDFEGYAFANGKAKLEPIDEGEEGQGNDAKIKKKSLVLDKTGSGRVDLSGLRYEGMPTEVEVEAEFRDPNGEMQTTAAKIPAYPSKRLVGVRPDSWYSSAKSLKFYVAATDLSGRAAPGSPIEVELLERKVFTHRKRLIGGFYSYENRSELKNLGSACSGRADSHGLLVCDIKPPVAGNIIIQAKTKDEDGREVFANASTWVYDKEEWWFEQADHDRIDILSEKKRYEPGETATFQVRMPFREATALVTVEREGILDAFTVPLKGNKPLVEVPIKSNYAPNAFVSILAVRGRVGDVQPTAIVDLGRPAYKLGIAEVNVGWRGHELKVKVEPEHEIYHVREKAKVKIRVSAPDGHLPADAEVLVAAVDEGLLELKPNDSWKLLDAMMSRRGHEVSTSTAQMHVVGKRHFGLKAVAHGGDGGRAPTREIFDSLLLWKARLPVDSRGEASLEVPLNDSMTSFRIVAVANAGTGLFGTGSASIRSTQDLMIFSGLPQLAHEGDQFPAEFTLRNATNDPMNVMVTGLFSGSKKAFNPLTFELAPHQAKIARWDVVIPSGFEELRYEVKAKSSNGASDRFTVKQRVAPVSPIRVFQSTLTQLDGEASFPVEKPRDGLPGKGGLAVALDRTILSGVAGVREYMRAYPYVCMEQRVSRAIALDDRAAWARITQDIPSYMDSDGLVRYYPTGLIEGSEVLTSYMVSVASEAGYSFPPNVLSNMMQGLRRFVSGNISRNEPIMAADLNLRKLAAIEALSRHGQASSKMLDSIEITPNLWPTSAVIDWHSILRRITGLNGIAERKKEAEQVLRSRLNFQGTMMGFSTEGLDDLWWLMQSIDANANRLILEMIDSGAWKDDLPRLVRGSFDRQARGHWRTTTANAWGVVAMRKFARDFEASGVKGKTTVELSSRIETLKWDAMRQSGKLSFAWPEGPSEMKIKHAGQGKPWATVQSLAAVPLKEPISTGYRLVKSWVPIEQKHPGQFTKGDVLRVHLELESQADRSWVVVSDPIPAGASVLGSGLGRDSRLLVKGERRKGDAWPIFEERAFEAFRTYYQYVPKGKWTIEYTMRLNQPGKMGLPPSRVEAMYSPEMFGETPNEAVSIAED